MHDLSTMIGRGSHIEEWRWPLVADDRRRVSTEISEALASTGLPWLEACLDPSRLAARLESEKCVTPEADEERASIMAALGAAGVTVAYQSEGFSAARAGKLRPDKVKALSFCYQLSEEWERALTAWDDYAAIFEGRFPHDHPEEVALRERRAFLAEKRGGRLTGSQKNILPG
jgi:hypothetical protein